MMTAAHVFGRSILAGGLASLLVMVAGTVLGTLRVLVVAPHTGDLIATLLELPLILAAGWYACAWAQRLGSVPTATTARMAMGLSALLALLVLEAALAWVVAGTAPAAFVARFAEPAAQLGLAAQILYAAFPLLQAKLTPPPR